MSTVPAMQHPALMIEESHFVKQLKNLALLMGATAVLLSGNATAETKKAAKPTAAKANDAKAAEAKPAEGKAPELVPSGPNFLYNASFETWNDDGTIAAWNVAEGSGDTWEKTTGTKVAAAPGGGAAAIELAAPGKDKLVALAQNVMPNRILHKRRLALSAQVKTAEKEQLHMLLTYKVNGKKETRRRLAQGTGEWEKLEDQFWVPEGADVNSFRVEFIVQKGTKDAIQIDDVRLHIMSPKGAPAPKAPAAPSTPPAKADAPKADAAKSEAAKPEAAKPATKEAPKKK